MFSKYPSNEVIFAGVMKQTRRRTQELRLFRRSKYHVLDQESDIIVRSGMILEKD